MRKRFDPLDLEPKNGDFASFVEKLNEKSVRELKALQVNDELMREQINDELNGAASNVWSSPDLDQSAPKHRDTVIAQPEDAFKVDIPQNNSEPRSVGAKAGTVSTFILICSFFLRRNDRTGKSDRYCRFLCFCQYRF